MTLQKRSIGLWVFLSCITFGIVGLVWFYKLIKELIEELNLQDIDNAALNLLFLIITLGVYGFWWNYKVSNYLNLIERKNEVEPNLLAPIFSLFFGNILHQSRINVIVSRSKSVTAAHSVTA